MSELVVSAWLFPICTWIGLVKNSLASDFTWFGHVAEKSKVCLFFGTCARIL